ncbi:MAG: aldehyde ferredoxin oxidoreductase family protein, partial [Candidatus Ranarchaeia archaeon]
KNETGGNCLDWFGYSGKILIIDLTLKKIEIKPLSEELPLNFLGGEGFACKLLYDYSEKGTDPLSPENPIVFAIGPFAGTPLPCTSKYAVASKSPLTNFLGYGISSGRFGFELRMCGFDAIIITGKSEKPCYLMIKNNKVIFEEASNIWGLLSNEAENEIKRFQNNERISVACIGPAGENLVKFAIINNDLSRQVGRTGLGAVMGSKNLKAIALEGSRDPKMANLQGVLDIYPQLLKEATGKATKKYRIWGTPANVTSLNNIGALPSYNFSKTTFDGAENISGELMIDEYLLKNIACVACPIACDHICYVEDGDLQDTKASIEYETIMAVGSNCGIDSLPDIIRANEMCDNLGMDTMSAGISLAWAIECYQKGIIGPDDTDGIELEWNSPKVQKKIFEMIAYRKGKLGKLLSLGSKAAAQQIGKNSIKYTAQVKGLELAGYSPRTLKSMGLGYATSTRGACHLRSGAYSFDIKGQVDRFKSDESRGALVSNSEDTYAIYDSVIFCKFVRGVISTLEDISNLLTLVTGMNFSVDDLKKIGRRIYNLQEAFSIREGLSKEDFYLPDRFFEEKVPDGIGKNTEFTKEEFELMLHAYFVYRGWDKHGKPSKETLEKLGLNEVIKDLYP